MRVALYGRVSTANHGQDVGMQLTGLREYCLRRGFEMGGEYVDQGISGAKDSRPALNRLTAERIGGSSMRSAAGNWTGLDGR